MSEPAREALERILIDACGSVGAAFAAAERILAEFLVVPRDSIVGTEYGVEQFRHDRSGWHVEKAFSRDSAIAAAKREHYDDKFEGRPLSRAVERPVIPPPPWSVIPLPASGEQRG